MPVNSYQRKTLIKDVPGKVRACAYGGDLPNARNNEHAFGKNVDRDDEGAGSVISRWTTATLSKEAQSQVSIVKQNKMACKQGATTSQAFRNFQKNHPEIRKNKARTGGNQQQNYKRIGTFGKPTVPSEAAMSSLIGGEYTSYDIDHEEYPDMSGQYKRGKLPNPRTTTAANGHNVNTDGLTTNPKPAQSAKEPFIMKKFKNAKSKV